ncbi:MAG: histidine phosphatase family protein [Halothiobacillaceae bacterium]
MSTRLDFLRHGQPVGGRRYRGDRVDDPLDATGWAQLRTRVVSMPADWDLIVTSPLSRCADFAGELAMQRGIPLRQMACFREIGFGHWEGLTHAEVRSRHASEYQAYRADPLGARPVGAEPLPAFADRVRGGMDELVGEQAGQRVLIVCHAVVMRMVACIALEAPITSTRHVATEYAAWLQLVHDGEQYQIRRLCNELPAADSDAEAVAG